MHIKLLKNIIIYKYKKKKLNISIVNNTWQRKISFTFQSKLMTIKAIKVFQLPSNNSSNF